MQRTREAKQVLANEKRLAFMESASRTVQPGLSYAAQVKQKMAEMFRPTQTPHPSTEKPARIQGTLMPFLGLFEEINDKLPEFKRCKTLEEQQFFITIFLFKKLANST